MTMLIFQVLDIYCYHLIVGIHIYDIIDADKIRISIYSIIESWICFIIFQSLESTYKLLTLLATLRFYYLYYQDIH
jgi:hypothetical protein